MHALRGLFLSLLTALVAASTLVTAPVRAQDARAVPHYDHIFVIVEENHGFTDVIGNPAAPNLNALANQFGLATDYFGISHPSEPNYMAMLGGSTFGVNSDNAYYMNAVSQPSLIQQLDKANISWKAYLQGLPHPGYQGICYPLKCNGSPDSDPLYVSKHDAIQNFTASLNAADWNRQVPVDQLDWDLSTGHVPFGLGCRQFTCEPARVKPLSPLLTVTGGPAVATAKIAPPNYATPTLTPVEPQSSTTSTASSGGGAPSRARCSVRTTTAS